MARDLVQEEPVFAATLRACDAVLQPLLGWSVWDATTASHGPPLVDSAVVQPALFAFAVALASLWRSWGVVPHALVGHSQGELAAACVSGALRLADAAQIVVARTRLLDSLRGRGAMALAEAPGELVQRLLAQTAAVSLAAENGPTSFVLAGEPQAIDQLVDQLIASGSFARRIQVDYASHCAPGRADSAAAAVRPGGLQSAARGVADLLDRR